MIRNQRGTMVSSVLLIALLACGGKSPVATSTIVPVQDPTNMGPAGGSLDLAGGAVRLQVPPGALGKSVNIEAVPAATFPSGGLLVAGTVYELRPADLRFGMLVTLSLRYDPKAVPSSVNLNELRAFAVGGAEWQSIAGSRELNGVVTAGITALGGFGVLGAPVASVSVSPQNVQVRSEQDIVSLSALARDIEGNALPRRAITWASSDTNSSRVSQAGLVVAATGTAMITATSDGYSGTATVQVVPGAAQAFMLEDFSTYTSTANLMANPRGTFLAALADSRIVLDQTVGLATSAKSMRYDFQIGRASWRERV